MNVSRETSEAEPLARSRHFGDTLPVPAALLRTQSLAAATFRDLMRRPGAWLALGSFGVLLLIVPRLARRALDDGSALGVELVLSTTWLYASVFAALSAVRAADPDAPLGPTAEFLVTPLRRGEYLVSRAAGITLAAGAHAALLVLMGALSLALNGDMPGLGVEHATAVAMGALHIAFFTTAGLAAGAIAGGQLAAIVVVALLVAARLVLPGITELGTAWSWWVPDPARLEISREIAFSRSVGAGAVWAAAAATTVQSTALLLLARFGLAAGGRTDRLARA